MYGQKAAQAFPARLFLSSLRGRSLPNWVGPLSLGIEHLSNEVVRQLSDHTLCERQRRDAFRALYSILIANGGHAFCVFTGTGSENDLPLPISIPFLFHH